MIVDVHVHLGDDVVFDHPFPEEDLVRSIDAFGVDVSLIQPGTVVWTEGLREQHDAIAQFVATHPGRAYGMANPNPHLPEAVYRQEVIRCMRELGFVGIKIQTAGHAVGIASTAAQKVYRVAQDLDVPVMLHTAATNFSSPLLAVEVAKANPNLRLVLAHAGGNGSGSEALVAALACDNIYLEMTWATIGFVGQVVRRLGAERVVFGSDQPTNLPVELAKFRHIGLSAGDLEECLSGTARRLYKLA